MTYFSKKTIASILFAALLSACGGQSTTDSATARSAQKTTQTIQTTSASSSPSGLLASLAEVYPNGQLPAANAAQAAKELAQNPAALHLTAQSTVKTTQSTVALIQSQAVATDYKAVTRIQNTSLTGAYFFTIYDTERTTALANNPNWKLEGAAFWASLAAGTGLNSVHRFRNNLNGSYLYTIYETEKADIQANYASTFFYEGVAWYAQQTQSPGWSPLYRFRNLLNGTYLFSAFETEKDAIVANYSAVFKLEGVAYYVRQDAPAISPPINLYKLPDTGIPSNQCYELGNDVRVSCTKLSAIALNPAQDGMLGLDITASNMLDGDLGFSYSEVTNPNGGNFSRTECIKDNLTNLIWEGKPVTGLRVNTNTYTNYDSTTEAQKYDPFTQQYVTPTQADLDSATNVAGYAIAVNSTNLCGFTDWRVPTQKELQSIVDYGVDGNVAPTLDANWFPNTSSNLYWSGNAYSTNARVVSFINGGSGTYERRYGFSVRLVRSVQ